MKLLVNQIRNVGMRMMRIERIFTDFIRVNPFDLCHPYSVAYK